MESAGSGGVGGLGGEEERAVQEAILSSKKLRKDAKRSKSLHALAKRLEMPVCLHFCAVVFAHALCVCVCVCVCVCLLCVFSCHCMFLYLLVAVQICCELLPISLACKYRINRMNKRMGW